MLRNRVALEISETLVKREQDPIGGQSGIHNCWICRTAKSFAGDRVGMVTEAAKIRHQFHRKVLVKLELHIARITLPGSARDVLRALILRLRPERH
jgi:hypothetical protein